MTEGHKLVVTSPVEDMLANDHSRHERCAKPFQTDRAYVAYFPIIGIEDFTGSFHRLTRQCVLLIVRGLAIEKVRDNEMT